MQFTQKGGSMGSRDRTRIVTGGIIRWGPTTPNRAPIILEVEPLPDGPLNQAECTCELCRTSGTQIQASLEGQEGLQTPDSHRIPRDVEQT